MLTFGARFRLVFGLRAAIIPSWQRNNEKHAKSTPPLCVRSACGSARVFVMCSIMFSLALVFHSSRAAQDSLRAKISSGIRVLRLHTRV